MARACRVRACPGGSQGRRWPRRRASAHPAPVRRSGPRRSAPAPAREPFRASRPPRSPTRKERRLSPGRRRRPPGLSTCHGDRRAPSRDRHGRRRTSCDTLPRLEPWAPRGNRAQAPPRRFPPSADRRPCKPRDRRRSLPKRRTPWPGRALGGSRRGCRPATKPAAPWFAPSRGLQARGRSRRGPRRRPSRIRAVGDGVRRRSSPVGDGRSIPSERVDRDSRSLSIRPRGLGDGPARASRPEAGVGSLGGARWMCSATGDLISASRRGWPLRLTKSALPRGDRARRRREQVGEAQADGEARRKRRSGRARRPPRTRASAPCGCRRAWRRSVGSESSIGSPRPVADRSIPARWPAVVYRSMKPG